MNFVAWILRGFERGVLITATLLWVMCGRGEELACVLFVVDGGHSLTNFGEMKPEWRERERVGGPRIID